MTWAAAEDVAAHTFVEQLDDEIEVAGADGHHLQRVRRLRAGEHVTVADGVGSWRRYEITDVAPGVLRLRAQSEQFTEPDSRPQVSLAVALTKQGALDTVVARCTEIGVTRITPIRTKRCVVRWDAAQAERAVVRLRTTAREAAAQSRRARLPHIGAVTDLAFFADRPGVVIADRGGDSVHSLVADRSRKEILPAEFTVIVGPEGGLDPVDLVGLEHLPRIGLGPHILRSETAPIVAVALLLDMARDLCRE